MSKNIITQKELKDLEIRFGGFVSGVRSKYTSEDLSLANKKQRMSQVCQGGDRMGSSERNRFGNMEQHI